jgi:hypothetical protein
LKNLRVLPTALYFINKKKEWNKDKEHMTEVICEFVSMWTLKQAERKLLTFYGRELVDFYLSNFVTNMEEKERLMTIKAFIDYEGGSVA